MARAADFVIIHDRPIRVVDKESITFFAPDSIEREVSGAILGFMFEVENLAALDIEVRLNDTYELTWHEAVAGRHPPRYVQEVINGTHILSGANQLNIAGTSAGKWSMQISDAVLWFRKNL